MRPPNLALASWDFELLEAPEEVDPEPAIIHDDVRLAGLGLVSTHRAVRDLAQTVARLAGPEDVVAHEGPIENSGAFEWYAGRRPVIVDGRRSVLGFGAERPEARDLFWDAARLRDVWTSGRRVWVVSVRTPARSVVADLPGARLLAVSGGRSLWVNEIR